MDSPKPSPRSELRLHCFLARGGVGSRRACERLIAAGRVAVDGAVVRQQGLQINPAVQRVTVDGRPVGAQAKISLLLNKPRGFLCTARDPQGRRTFRSLLPAGLGARLFTVGRLDGESEGLLAATSDGLLAHALMHPRHNVSKQYLVWTRRPLPPAAVQRLRQGVWSRGEKLELDALERRPYAYHVRLHAGHNRHIRRMFAAVGAEVTRLKRIAVGPLELGNLPAGGWRYLTPREMEACLALLGRAHEA